VNKLRVVFADNDVDFLNTRKEFLEDVGIEVIPATTLPKARQALGMPGIHLAILDVRLENNKDDKDMTGLLLATEEDYLLVPKIILTGYDKEEHLVPKIGGKLPLYLAYIQKDAGPEAMLAAIIKALATVTSRSLEGEHDRRFLPDNRKVFIVHGHDIVAKQDLEILLRILDLEPIILNEQIVGGKTIIEALERHSEVSFAIVILTPDDFGGSKMDPATAIDRPRQNVVFEMGYFIGKLGRQRVLALLKGGVELPSDLRGVLYVEMDSHKSWHRQVFRELREAGFDIDPKKIV